MKSETTINNTNLDKATSGTETVQALFKNVKWTSDTEAFCECPGINLHTNPTGPNACKVYLDRYPNVFCLHESCSNTVMQAARNLRESLSAKKLIKLEEVNKEQRLQIEHQQKYEQRIRLRAANSLPTIMERHRWTYADIQAASPVKIPSDRFEQSKRFLERFPDKGLIWIGAKHDSGKVINEFNFKTRDEWLKKESLPNPLISPCLFKDGSISRSKDNVISRPFLVVESDTHSKDEVGAIFKWLEEQAGLKLVAVVDTGGKSLHGWFELPEGADLTEAKLVLPALGCDAAMFVPSQPVRLPGGLRTVTNPDGTSTDQTQQLIYLKAL